MIYTDQAPSTKVTMTKIKKVFKLDPNCHCISKYLNNLIEQDHRYIKVRKTKYQSINTAKIQSKGLNVFMDDFVAKLKLYAHLYITIKANIVLTVKSFVNINYFSFFSINIT